MQRYASSTGENNSAESPISNAAGASSMGNDASDQGVGDDSGLQAQTEAEIAAEKRQSSKFVYKLFRMVSDQDYQHLISWNRNGTSVMVCNFDEFAKEVLGKHFKHSNFSSFIRQLNMYGFYKVNKTPRGHRQSVDTQIWEFSHPKFLRGRPELLEDIRRKALDSEHARVEARDLQYSVSVGQMQLRQQVEEIQFRLDETMEQNLALRNFTTQLRDTMSQILDHIKKTNGGRLPFEANIPTLEMPSPMPHSGMWGTPFHDGPPIFVTEPEFGVGGMVPGVRHPSEFSGNDPFATSLPGSRRVSQGSSQGEAMTPMGGGSASGDQSLGPNGPIGPPVFGHGPRGPFGDNGGSPQHAGMHGMGRPIAGKPGLSGLAIDTSAASSPQLYQSGVSPTSAGLTASNAGLGVGMMSLPPSPLTPQHQAMMAAINTPLPPSPAPGSTNGGQFHSFDPGNSPYMHSPSATTTTAVDDMLGPNSKAMRTPMKRTASNSHSTAAGFKGTPTMNSGMSTPSSPGSMKRKSPI
ncbi:hypothetical protein IE53DRAFT_341776 [Violaceomyces palustris]|uniref:Uncharacterized protein n=1 Tax=Violaceomyces palustris TaxID=1673888 RepID=A0ACD0P195_9BASI|nr:hypothetical protein IE53DRAFT_341776 [Violaceomyces palustris]